MVNEQYRYSRTKERSGRRRKNYRFLYRFVAIAVVFAIGFFSGKAYEARKYNGKDSNVNGETVEVTGESVNTSPQSSDEANSEKAQQPAQQNSELELENKKLADLKDSFVAKMKEKYPGVELSLAIKNLDTGAEVIHNNKQMNSASVIKLFILETVYNKHLDGEYELTDDVIKDLTVMITKSDNKAANRFIDDFGGENEKRKVDETNEINKFIKQAGYTKTVLNRKMYDTMPPGGPSGYQNYTCAEDVLTFLEGIYNKSLLEEPYNTQTLELMKKQERTAKIPGKIKSGYPGITIANKTGELSQVENDVALIMCEDYNLAFIVLTGEIPYKSDGSTDYALKEEIQKTISEFGLELVELYEGNNDI